MRKLVLLLVVFFLIGCAVKSGVVQIGPDVYMVSREAAIGFSDFENLKYDAFQEADKYCKSQNKHISVINTIEYPPAYIWGKSSKVEVHFMCLNKTATGSSNP